MVVKEYRYEHLNAVVQIDDTYLVRDPVEKQAILDNCAAILSKAWERICQKRIEDEKKLLEQTN